MLETPIYNTPSDKQNKESNIITESEVIATSESENRKYYSINRTPSYNNNTIEIKKKKKVSFIDQIHAKKDLAEIIFINDKVSLKDDKLDSNKYLEEYKRRNNDFNNKEKTNNIETYKIKRPKRSSSFSKRKKETVDEHYTCGCSNF